MKPIIFSAPMVRAILEGRKTQTRRVVRGIPECARLVGYTAESDQSELAHSLGWFEEEACDLWPCNRADRIRCPYGQPGDLLWVQETWQEFFHDELPGDRPAPVRGRMGIPSKPERHSVVAYRADGEMPDHPEHGKALWKSPIHMPKWASRLTLSVTDVRVQRLQEITEEDVQAEGCTGSPYGEQADAMLFPALWDSLNAERGHSWDSNPWVWAITFEPLPGEGS